ncbi:unnamed protein product [Trichogramma brassicae]|uniref:Uncharacterized protein n=1 Tax=Trichogramma brassicae TaxID=86971 RepID=A0A6H5IWJ1_9HYME|nr:unnamed protein product [Trichogramma brassicae]
MKSFEVLMKFIQRNFIAHLMKFNGFSGIFEKIPVGDVLTFQGSSTVDFHHLYRKNDQLCKKLMIFLVITFKIHPLSRLLRKGGKGFQVWSLSSTSTFEVELLEEMQKNFSKFCSALVEQNTFLKILKSHRSVLMKNSSQNRVFSQNVVIFLGNRKSRLSSLLKTAEDLHIKGLAEVSWRNDAGINELTNSGHHSPGSGGTPGVETVLREGTEEPEHPTPPKQRRRGRPPLDDTPSVHDVFTPKLPSLSGQMKLVKAIKVGTMMWFLNTKTQCRLVRDFWSEPGPADILAKLKRKEITLFRAAEFLNVTVHTLATYLSTLQGPDRITLAGDLTVAATGTVTPVDMLTSSNEFDTSDCSVNDILQKMQNANTSSAAAPTTSTAIKREGGGYVEVPAVGLVPKAASSVLENNPDITIVKAETIQRKRPDYTKITATENNNAKLMSGGAVSKLTQSQIIHPAVVQHSQQQTIAPQQMITAQTTVQQQLQQMQVQHHKQMIIKLIFVALSKDTNKNSCIIEIKVICRSPDFYRPSIENVNLMLDRSKSGLRHESFSYRLRVVFSITCRKSVPIELQHRSSEHQWSQMQPRTRRSESPCTNTRA